ncbi:MAG: hypothetical protein ACD_62C00126G0008 [uncultured bacterium]|nr:MAG: hypothetical protein ACD_62C00126G0008 [uncultured bacterium]HLD46090.1 hypothetical protein [bacterium]
MPKKTKHIKSKKSKKTTAKKSVKIDPINSIEHYNAILLEEMRSEFKFVIEHTSDIEKRLNARMDEHMQRINKTCANISGFLPPQE